MTWQKPSPNCVPSGHWMNNGVSIEEYLNTHGTLTYTNKGVSMLPLLRQGRDLFTVEKKGPERCKVGDVVLFRHGDDYVLHRVILVGEKSYIILGDNCVNPETGVKDADILGVMTGYVRNGKRHSVQDPLYRAYSYVILRTRRVRVFCKRTFMNLYIRLRVRLRRWLKGR